MLIVVTSNHTRVKAWVNSKMYHVKERSTSISILYTTINYPARISHNHRRHEKLGLQLSLKKNQKHTLVIKKNQDTWYLNGFPTTGSNLGLTV